MFVNSMSLLSEFIVLANKYYLCRPQRKAEKFVGKKIY